jgi:hypothetical protein
VANHLLKRFPFQKGQDYSGVAVPALHGVPFWLSSHLNINHFYYYRIPVNFVKDKNFLLSSGVVITQGQSIYNFGQGGFPHKKGFSSLFLFLYSLG